MTQHHQEIKNHPDQVYTVLDSNNYTSFGRKNPEIYLTVLYVDVDIEPSKGDGKLYICG